MFVNIVVAAPLSDAAIEALPELSPRSEVTLGGTVTGLAQLEEILQRLRRLDVRVVDVKLAP